MANEFNILGCIYSLKTLKDNIYVSGYGYTRNKIFNKAYDECVEKAAFTIERTKRNSLLGLGVIIDSNIAIVAYLKAKARIDRIREAEISFYEKVKPNPAYRSIGTDSDELMMHIINRVERMLPFCTRIRWSGGLDLSKCL